MFASTLTVFLLIYLLYCLVKRDDKANPFLIKGSRGNGFTVVMLKSHLQKAVGLLNHHTLNENHGIILANTRKIHTFGMRFKIDVVGLNKDFFVTEIYPYVGFAEKVVFKRPTKHVLEIPAGSADQTFTVGEKLLVRFESNG